MGSQYINGFIDQGIDQDTALKIQLQANHFPPVDLDFIPACKAALDACNCEDYEKEIKLPNGRILTAARIVEGLHLECFLENYND